MLRKCKEFIIHKSIFKVKNPCLYMQMLADRAIKLPVINSSIGGLGERKTFRIIGKLLKCKVCNPIKIKLWIFY